MALHASRDEEVGHVDGGIVSKLSARKCACTLAAVTHSSCLAVHFNPCSVKYAPKVQPPASSPATRRRGGHRLGGNGKGFFIERVWCSRQHLGGGGKGNVGRGVV